MNVVFHYAAGPDLAARLATVAGEGLAIEICGEYDDARLATLLPETDVLWHVLRPVAEEPIDPSSKLLALPNVVLTPHIAWLTTGTFDRSFALAAENCRRLTAGAPLLHQVV